MADCTVCLSFDFDAITFRVTTIDPPAEAAGLRKGDVVLAVNGRSIGGVADYIGAVRRARAGDRLRVRIRRSTSEVQRHDADRDASRLSHNVSELCLIWHYAESLRRLA